MGCDQGASVRGAIVETVPGHGAGHKGVNWGLRGCFPLDVRPLGWGGGFRRALRELKMGGK
jgi:hypothetical protein